MFQMDWSQCAVLILGVLWLLWPGAAMGWQQSPAAQSSAAAQSAALTALQKRVEVLECKVQQLQQQLQQRQGTVTAGPASPPSAPAASAHVAQIAPAAAEPSPAGSLLPVGTTVNVLLDGYYSWNLNRPFNRTNQLRSFDQTDNAFTLSQAAVILERHRALVVRKEKGNVVRFVSFVSVRPTTEFSGEIASGSVR